MIVRVSVVLRKTVLDDLSGSDYQSQDDDDDFDDDFRSGCRSVSQSSQDTFTRTIILSNLR